MENIRTGKRGYHPCLLLRWHSVLIMPCRGVCRGWLVISQVSIQSLMKESVRRDIIIHYQWPAPVTTRAPDAVVRPGNADYVSSQHHHTPLFILSEARFRRWGVWISDSWITESFPLSWFGIFWQEWHSRSMIIILWARDTCQSGPKCQLTAAPTGPSPLSSHWPSGALTSASDQG